MNWIPLPIELVGDDDDVLDLHLHRNLFHRFEYSMVKNFWIDFLIEFFSHFVSHDEKQTKTDGKYLVLPSGELHIREVGPEDGYKSYQCRTKHRLTGEARLSATKGRLVITGMSFMCHSTIAPIWLFSFHHS